jgi:hypothetical protein
VGRLYALAAVVFVLTAIALGDTLDWRSDANRVDADFKDWPIEKVLERVAAVTHWQVYVEPGTGCVVSAKFKDRPPGEALPRLLSGLNYALVPVTNAPPRLYVFRNDQARATQALASPESDGHSRRIANELLVTLKPGSKESIEEIARRLGATVVGRVEATDTYRLRFQDAAAAKTARDALAAAENIAGLEDNYMMNRPQGPGAGADGGAPPLNLRPRTTNPSGQVVIGLVDTAVQPNGTVLKDFLLPGVSVAGPSDLSTSQITHGSGMAETILYGLARTPEAADGTAVRILPIDVYGDSPSTTTFGVALGIQAAINGGADVVNLSLGTEQDSPMVRALIQAGHARGVVFIAAAGNEPVTTPTYPAAYPEVVAVTAIDRTGQIASYANRGSFVDLAASGSSVVPFDGQSYMMVGTSTATANVSAIAAALMSATGKRGADAENLLRAAANLKPAGTGR